MGFQLRKRLHRGKGDTCNHLTLFQGEVSRLKNLAENEFLEDVHHLRIRTLPGQGFTAEQGVIILFANFYSIHIIRYLCHRGQASCQHKGDKYDCLFH